MHLTQTHLSYVGLGDTADLCIGSDKVTILLEDLEETWIVTLSSEVAFHFIWFGRNQMKLVKEAQSNIIAIYKLKSKKNFFQAFFLVKYLSNSDVRILVI